MHTFGRVQHARSGGHGNGIQDNGSIRLHVEQMRVSFVVEAVKIDE
jgi:hypothetical protein